MKSIISPYPSHLINTEEGYLIAEVYDSLNNDQNKANRDLICAAPDMYEALKEALEAIEKIEACFSFDKAFLMITAAINKAEGNI